MKKRYLAMIGGLAIGLNSLLGCSEQSTPEVFHKIANVRADAAAWQGRTVRLQGKVSGLFSLPVMDSAVYELDDGTGTILVVTSRGLPAKGERVLMSGTVSNVVMIGTMAGGLTVKEDRRW